MVPLRWSARASGFLFLLPCSAPAASFIRPLALSIAPSLRSSFPVLFRRPIRFPPCGGYDCSLDLSLLGDGYTSPFVLAASWIALHTFHGEAGMSMWVTPRWPKASITALITAGWAAMAPDSPIPFTPIGLVGEGVSVRSRIMFGISDRKSVV